METPTPPPGLSDQSATPPDPGRGRRRVLLVAALFTAPILVAMGLRALGWEPGGLKNSGTLIDPPVALADTPARSTTGEDLDWAVDERGFNLLVQAPRPCRGECAALYDTLHRVWQTQGRHADRVRVLWEGPLPEGAEAYPALLQARFPSALRARLPQRPPGAAAVDLVDGRGFLALHYPAGFDASGLRRDLGRLLK